MSSPTKVSLAILMMKLSWRSLLSSTGWLNFPRQKSLFHTRKWAPRVRQMSQLPENWFCYSINTCRVSSKFSYSAVKLCHLDLVQRIKSCVAQECWSLESRDTVVRKISESSWSILKHGIARLVLRMLTKKPSLQGSRKCWFGHS